MGSIPCLLYTILCVVFEARVINLCDRDIATNFGAVAGEVILVDFLLRVHCIAPRWSTFQGVSRSVDVILVKDFANSIDILLVWQSFLFWNQISYFNGDVYSSLIVEMKSERCPFSKRPFENQAFLSKIQHTLFEIYSPLIVMYFENRNWPVVRLKWFLFFMVLCIHFRLWFWAYLLMVCNEVTFCEFQKTKGSSQNLRIHQERLFSFFSITSISMHNNL